MVVEYVKGLSFLDFVAQHSLTLSGSDEGIYRTINTLFWGGYYEEIIPVLETLPDEKFNSDGVIAILYMLEAVFPSTGDENMQRLDRIVTSSHKEIFKSARHPGFWTCLTHPDFKDTNVTWNSPWESSSDSSLTSIRFFDVKKILSMDKTSKAEYMLKAKTDTSLLKHEYLQTALTVERCGKNLNFENEEICELLKEIYRILPRPANTQLEYLSYVAKKQLPKFSWQLLNDYYKEFPARYMYYWKNCKSQNPSRYFKRFKQVFAMGKLQRRLSRLRKRAVESYMTGGAQAALAINGDQLVGNAEEFFAEGSAMVSGTESYGASPEEFVNPKWVSFKTFVSDHNLDLSPTGVGIIRSLYMLYWAGYYEDLITVIEALPIAMIRSDVVRLVLCLLDDGLCLQRDRESNSIRHFDPPLDFRKLRNMVNPDFEDTRITSFYELSSFEGEPKFPVKYIDTEKLFALPEETKESLVSGPSGKEPDYLRASLILQTAGGARRLKKGEGVMYIKSLFLALPRSGITQLIYLSFLSKTGQEASFKELSYLLHNRFPGRNGYYLQNCNDRGPDKVWMVIRYMVVSGLLSKRLSNLRKKSLSGKTN